MTDLTAAIWALLVSFTVGYWFAVGFYSDDEKKAGKLITSWQMVWAIMAMIPWLLPISFLGMIVNAVEYRFLRHRGLVFIDDPVLHSLPAASNVLEGYQNRPIFFEELAG